jgi:hypothetical protein
MDFNARHGYTSGAGHQLHHNVAFQIQEAHWTASISFARLFGFQDSLL